MGGASNWFEAGGYLRLEPRRRDDDWLAARLDAADTRFVAVWRDRNLVTDGAPVWLTGDDLRSLDAPVDTTVLLGEHEARAYFAVALDGADETVGEALATRGRLADLRDMAGELARPHAALLAYARAMAFWHRQHRFCGACGARTRATEGGHVRRCTGETCGKSHFPRTDPAVIVLVEHGERCLLGRSHGWPPGMYSTVAGFVEPGESLEDAVRREVEEETGVPVGAVRYRHSQPWPFPSSLMLGFHAEALDTALTVDPHELDDAMWLTRDELIAAVVAGRLRLPRRVSIARRLVEEWFAVGGRRIDEALAASGAPPPR